MFTIGVSLQFQDTYDQEVARGLIEWAREKPQWRLTGPIGGMMELRPGRKQALDALVVRIEHASDIRKYENLGIPVIDVAGAYPHSDFYRVQNDDRQTGRLAGELIRDLGALSFAYLGVSGTLWSTERLKGFEEALSSRLSVDHIFTRTLSFYKNPGYSKTLDRFLSSLQVPTAFFCCNDIAAVKVTNHLLSSGIEIPRQASVVSVDNDALLCALAHPSLTSIALECRSIGYRIGELVSSLIDGAELSRAPVLIPPSGVIERESTQLMLSHDPTVMKALVYIRNHAHLGIGVEDVAAFSSTSRRNLELKWKKVRDRSIHEEIINVRLQRAKRLLRETTGTVETVSSECGFRTTQRLYALFREKFGCTPGEWRAMSTI